MTRRTRSDAPKPLRAAVASAVLALFALPLASGAGAAPDGFQLQTYEKVDAKVSKLTPTYTLADKEQDEVAKESAKVDTRLDLEKLEAELKPVERIVDLLTLPTETFVTPYGEITLTYEEVGGRTVVGGDMLVDLEALREQAASDGVEYGSDPGDASGDGYGSTRSGLAAVRRSEKLWPGAVVPFVVDPTLTNTGRVTQAIAHWQQFTPLRFVPRTNEADFVAFVPDADLCASFVGRQGGRQEILLADGCLRGQVIHEIGHAVGIFHEQSREDRDDHVVIHWENIESGKEHNFDKYSDATFLWWGGQDGQDMGPYDFASIMHYGSMAFSDDGTSNTIERRNDCSGTGCLIAGQRLGLSTNDKRYLHELYCPLVGWNPTLCANYLEPAEGPTYEIVQKYVDNEKCLDVANASLSAQAPVNEVLCHGGNNQLWQIQPDPDGTGTFFVRNKNSGQCLDVPGGSTGFVGVNQFPCNGGDNQRFTLYHAPGAQYEWINRKHGRFSLRPLHSGMCLGIDWQHRLQQTDCSSNVARVFEFQVREFPFADWKVVSDTSGWCLDIPSSSTADVPVQLYPCHGGENQTFGFVPRPNGSFAIRAKHSDRCLGLRSGDLIQVDCGTPDAPNYATGFFLHLMGDTLQLRTESPRLCAGIGGSSTDVDTATCTWNYDERFRLERN